MKLEDMCCHFPGLGRNGEKRIHVVRKESEFSSNRATKSLQPAEKVERFGTDRSGCPGSGALLHCPSSEARRCRPPSPPPKGILSGSCALEKAQEASR